MRMLFSTTPGLGHFHPLVPLARALEDAGNEVAFAGLDAARPIVEAAGFQFLSAERGIPVAERELDIPQRTPELCLANELLIHSGVFCRIIPSLTVPGLVDIGRTWQPDLYIRESAEYGAVIAAEHLGLPHAVVSCFATLHGAEIFEQDAAREFGPACEELGGPSPQFIAASLYRYLYLSYSPPAFSTRDATGAGVSSSIPSTTHFIRPQFFDRAASAELPALLSRLPSRPTVYVTMGTEANGLPAVYPTVLQTIIDGLSDEDVNVIVTLGYRGDPADFTVRGSNVHLYTYIPQSALLPHCDLVIMHGGSNTLLAVIDAGLPCVVVPLIADQFFNAHVVQDVGLGRVIQPPELSPATVRSTVTEVLANPEYRRSAGRLQAEMRRMSDQSHAVELIQELATDGRPIENPRLPLDGPGRGAETPAGTLVLQGP